MKMTFFIILFLAFSSCKMKVSVPNSNTPVENTEENEDNNPEQLALTLNGRYFSNCSPKDETLSDSSESAATQNVLEIDDESMFFYTVARQYADCSGWIKYVSRDDATLVVSGRPQLSYGKITSYTPTETPENFYILSTQERNGFGDSFVQDKSYSIFYIGQNYASSISCPSDLHNNYDLNSVSFSTILQVCSSQNSIQPEDYLNNPINGAIADVAIIINTAIIGSNLSDPYVFSFPAPSCAAWSGANSAYVAYFHSGGWDIGINSYSYLCQDNTLTINIFPTNYIDIEFPFDVTNFDSSDFKLVCDNLEKNLSASTVDIYGSSMGNSYRKVMFSDTPMTENQTCLLTLRPGHNLQSVSSGSLVEDFLITLNVQSYANALTFKASFLENSTSNINPNSGWVNFYASQYLNGFDNPANYSIICNGGADVVNFTIAGHNFGSAYVQSLTLPPNSTCELKIQNLSDANGQAVSNYVQNFSTGN